MAYSQDEKRTILEKLLKHVSNGGTVRGFCREEGMPVNSVVYDWIEEEGYSERFARARLKGFDSMADECIEIAARPSPTTMNGGTDSGDVQHRKLQIETRLKLLARWDPKRYGERVAVDHSGVIGSKKARNLGALSTEELATLEALEAKATEPEE